ncbi:MAG: cytochrome c peroxidase [Alphaproteobacteria bacterium]
MAGADSFDKRSLWLPRGDALAGALKTRPRRYLDLSALSQEKRAQVMLGAVLFRAPQVLGPEARRIGMSCETCHTSGHVNARLFLPGLSSRNGTVDLTSKVFHRPADDGRFNPLRIPSLRGAARTAPYGHRGRFATIAAFARHVIVDEFGGAAPLKTVLKAIAAYVGALKRPANPLLGPDGRLTSKAPANAKRGERLFFKAGKKGGGQACASCHIPARGFTDGRRHDVGTGGAVDTPSLLGLANGPYFHDARHDFLGPAVGHFTQRFGIGNDAKGFADLVAYLRVVGAVGSDRERVTLARDLGEIVAGEGVIDALLARRDNAALGLVVATLRRDLGRVHDRFPGAGHAAARRVLVAWSRGLQGVRRAAEAGDHTRAQRLLATLRKDRPAWRKVLEAAETTSLYDPARLDTFLAQKQK